VIRHLLAPRPGRRQPPASPTPPGRKPLWGRLSSPRAPAEPTLTPPSPCPPLSPALQSVALDMQPVVDELEAAGCSGDNLRLLAWEVPRIFSRHTFRRYLRQFAHLGLYGLSCESRGASKMGSSRAVRATMMLHPFG
jgi:hypothetical protein